MQIEALRDRMRARLNDVERGVVLCDVMDSHERDELDQRRLVHYLASQFALLLDGKALKPLAADRARDVAQRAIAGLMHRPKVEDSRLADAFFDLFSTTRRYYATYEYKGGLEERSYIGTSLLGVGLDEGVLVIDDERIGVLWVGDDT